MKKEDKYGAWHVPLKRARLTHAQFLQIVYGFAIDLTAAEVARATGVSVRTVTTTYQRLREVLVSLSDRGHLDRHPDPRTLEFFSELRRAKHPGWRKKFDPIYERETTIRLQYRGGGWRLFGDLLEHLYNVDQLGYERLGRGPPSITYQGLRDRSR